MRRLLLCAAGLLTVVASVGLYLFLQPAETPAETPVQPPAKPEPAKEEPPKMVSTLDRVLPGLRKDGFVQLPNQWSLKPAGRHLEVGDLPVNIAHSPHRRVRRGALRRLRDARNPHRRSRTRHAH